MDDTLLRRFQRKARERNGIVCWRDSLASYDSEAILSRRCRHGAGLELDPPARLPEVPRAKRSPNPVEPEPRGQPFQGDNMPESPRTRPPPGPKGTRLRLR